MSAYSEISKEIGWDQRQVNIPSFEEITKLTEGALNRDRESFKKLFEILRFAPSPSTDEEVEVQNIIYDGFHKAKKIFE